MTIIIDEASAKLASFFNSSENDDKYDVVVLKADGLHYKVLSAVTECLETYNLVPSECVWIVSDSIQKDYAQYLGITAVGEPQTGTKYAVESISDIDVEYLERVRRRRFSIPWDIGQTDRCLIRELSLEDLPALYELYAKPGMTDYVEPLYPYEKELEYEKSYLDYMYGFYEYGMWLVFSKETGELIGRAGLEHREYGDETELEMGYMIAPEYQHQGYATEVCRFILEYAKENTAFERINCLIDRENTASVKLVEKLGFKYMGESDEPGKSGRPLDRYVLKLEK